MSLDPSGYTNEFATFPIRHHVKLTPSRGERRNLHIPHGGKNMNTQDEQGCLRHWTRLGPPIAPVSGGTVSLVHSSRSKFGGSLYRKARINTHALALHHLRRGILIFSRFNVSRVERHNVGSS